MKIGASFVLGFIGIKKIDDFMEYVNSKDMQVVEIVAEPPLCFIDEIDATKRKQITKLADDLQLELTLHATFSDINIAALNPNVREANNQIIKRSIQFASDIKGEIVTIHPGNPGAGGISHPNLVKKNNKESIKELSNFASNMNIKLGYENFPKMPWILFEESFSPLPIREFIEEINLTNLGITWDLGHSNTTEFPLIEFYENFKDYIIHLHLHDNDGPVKGWADKHTPIGSGNIDWEELFRLLKQINYKEAYILELNTVEKIEQSLDYLSSYL
ncbi:MAG: sugar phosphate isomerase/epimerase [Asgard group archaeon]|nr:sugar phosphate isomerase/epimerase [Asgard group archaeon]